MGKERISRVTAAIALAISSLFPVEQVKGAAFLLGWNVLIWGIVALCPFAMFSTSPVYRYYENYAPEWAWGLGFAALGVLQITQFRRGGFLAWLAAGLLSAGFAFTAYLLMRASYLAPSGYVAVFYSVVQIVYTVQLARTTNDGD